MIQINVNLTAKLGAPDCDMAPIRSVLSVLRVQFAPNFTFSPHESSGSDQRDRVNSRHTLALSTQTKDSAREAERGETPPHSLFSTALDPHGPHYKSRFTIHDSRLTNRPRNSHSFNLQPRNDLF